MDHYIDLQILPDPEFPPHQIMEALYSKFHRVMVKNREWQVAVAFPQWKVSQLGSVFRLLGSHQSLRRLMDSDWLRGLRDHLTIDTITEVPSSAHHRRVIRVQSKSSAARLRRRAMKRHQLDARQALERIPESVSERLKLPFVELRSSSTQQRFRLFIRISDQTEKSDGTFNRYGLSSSAAVPWF